MNNRYRPTLLRAFESAKPVGPTRHRSQRYLATIVGLTAALTTLLAACTAAPTPASTPIPANAPSTGAFCTLHVEGNQILDARNRVVVLHGANLPTFAEMTTSGPTPDERLKALADAGAKIIRLPVDTDELLPAFIPGTLIPFVERANKLGLVVVVRLHTDPKLDLNSQADESEAFMRQIVAHPVSGTSGLWLEPFDRPLNSIKERSALQSMVDVVRGYQRDQMILVSDTGWMLEGDNTAPLAGGNIVYGADVENMNRFPLKDAPFMFPSWMSRSVAEDDLGIGVIATSYDPNADGLNGKVLREYWQKQNAKYGNDLLSC